MSSSVNLYTLGNMEKATCTLVTNFQPDFPKENLVDYNPDTYWEASGAAIHVFKIDLRVPLFVDTLILLIQDYKSNWAGNSLKLESSDDDIAYSNKLSASLGGPTTQQILIRELSQSDTKRYWKMQIDFGGGVTSSPKIAGLFLCRKHTISQGNEWPEPDLETYENRSANTAGSRSFVSAINKNKTETLQRTYQLLQGDMTTLQDAFNDSLGSLFPLILQEDGASHYVRFADDTLNQNQIDYQLYAPTVTFVQQPYISDGENY